MWVLIRYQMYISGVNELTNIFRLIKLPTWTDKSSYFTQVVLIKRNNNLLNIELNLKSLFKKD